jgi:hypothetical protein
MDLQNQTSRRNFFRTGAAGALIAGAPALLKGAPAGEVIKVGLVGCGGRGTGAANQALCMPTIIPS